MSLQVNPHGASDERMALVFEAVKQGITLVEEDENIAPFLVTDSAITILATKTIHDAFAVVQKVMDSEQVERSVLVYNGYLTIEGNRTRALFVEGFERSREKGVRFAQRYRPGTKARLFSKARPIERRGRLTLLAGNVEYRNAR